MNCDVAGAAQDEEDCFRHLEGSISAPASLAACNGSAGQSASKAEITGPGEIWIGYPMLVHLPASRLSKASNGHFEAE